MYRQMLMVIFGAVAVLVAIANAHAHCPLHPEDMIDCIPELAQVIAPALTAAELATVTEAMFRRQQQEAHVELDTVVARRRLHIASDTNDPIEAPIPIIILDPHMAMAYAHVMHGGSLRVGDIVALHGAVLAARCPSDLTGTGISATLPAIPGLRCQPGSYELAKKWQALMDMLVKCQADINCSWF